MKRLRYNAIVITSLNRIISGRRLSMAKLAIRISSVAVSRSALIRGLGPGRIYLDLLSMRANPSMTSKVGGITRNGPQGLQAAGVDNAAAKAQRTRGELQQPQPHPRGLPPHYEPPGPGL